jgi:hypothetical protein
MHGLSDKNMNNTLIYSNNDSAAPALRGFRLQILYTLARLVESETALEAKLFWPEGIEDLAIFDSQGQLHEAVQIKGHTAPLTLSELLPKSGNGYLRRMVDIAFRHPESKLRLMSFGQIGQELSEAWSGESNSRQRVKTKLIRAQFKPQEIDLLFSRLELEQIEEDLICDQIHSFFRNFPTLGGQAEHATAILCHWLYGAAERRERITQSDMVFRLTEIGRYLHAREGYWRDWFSVIEPLGKVPIVDLEIERLNAQFQQGISVRYEHILAGCDVPRGRWLDQITQGFSRENIVIVHGASGQGKSALAYRWLHDETPDLWGFEIKLIETRRDALQIATALSGHARAVGVPMTIYIDVRPGNIGWTELVETLAVLPLMRILVTIREEDWRRSTISRAIVTFTDISLSLDITEAKNIYHSLGYSSNSGKFLSFEDAWHRFVNTATDYGPLMEFIYLITRTETLRERLKNQVDAIRDNILLGKGNIGELKLLALVAFASAYGARLEISALRKSLVLLDLGRTVERLECEYLLRIINQGLLDGLHPVRSRLLTEILCDGLTFDALELARDCLSLIPAEDTEIFLFHVAAKHADLMPSIEQYLSEWQPRTWAAHGGIFRALLWWGVRQYADQVSGLVDEIKTHIGSKAWLAILDLDIANLLPPDGTAIWKQLDFITQEQKSRFQSFIDRQPLKTLAQKPAREWLGTLCKAPAMPSTESDWAAIAELSYWIGHLSIDCHMKNWLCALELDHTLEMLPLPQLSELIHGQYELDNERLRLWLIKNRSSISERYQKETNTAWLEETNQTIRAHFIFSWRYIIDNPEASQQKEQKQKNIYHSEAMWRVRLLRGIFPNYEGYGCQGYGHKILPMPYDETQKGPIKPEYLPAEWPVQFNSFVSGLIDWEYRPEGWNDYLTQIWLFRESMVAVMRNFRRVFIAHFRDKHKREPISKRMNQEGWDTLKSLIAQDVLLPRHAVDEWGFVTEGKEAKDESKDESKANNFESRIALSPFQRYLKGKSELIRCLDNFMTQVTPHICLHCANGQAGVELSRILIENHLKEANKNLVRESLVTHNLADAFSALPNFQREFRYLFGTRFTASQLNEQDRLETESIESVLMLWAAYVTHPTAHWSNPEQRAFALWNHPTDYIPQRLMTALILLENDGIQATHIKKHREWEGEPALFITLASENPLHILASVSLVKPLLRKAIAEAKLSTEHTASLLRRWRNIVIVPLFKCRSLDRLAWLIPMHRLAFQDNSEEFEWLDEIPRPIDHDKWQTLGLKCWAENDEVANAIALMQSIGKFKALLDHLSGWIDLARQDESDREVLQNYLNCWQGEWSGIVQALIDRLSSIASTLDKLPREVWMQRPYLLEAFDILQQHYQGWLPPGLENGEAIMSVDVCASWANQVLASITELHTLGAAILVDTLSQTATLEPM